MNSPANPKTNLIRGALWTVGTRWLIKGIGFINTVIMARLLLPQDYGVVAMGMLVVGLIQTFIDFSATLALLRKDEITREEIDSTWTLRLIQGVIAGVAIFLVAPLAVDYFKEPKLLYVLWTFSACVVIASISNIGQTLALKNFNYLLDFKIQTAGKVASVVTTVIFGILLGDYRALVIGIVAGYLTPLVLSYTLHPYRPKWETSKLAEIWLITKWLLLTNIGGFILRKGDELIAGRIGTTHQFGVYNVSADLGQLPVGELGPAMLRALLPVLASIQEDIERTKSAVLKTMSAMNAAIWPVGLGFAALSAEATLLLLGKNWLEATPFVAIFAVNAALQTSTSPLKTFLILKGSTKVQTHIVWMEFVSFLLGAWILVPSYHLIGLAYARLLSNCLASMITLVATRRHCGLELIPTAKTILRPLAGSLAMYYLVVSAISTVDPLWLKLMIGMLLGAVFYTIYMLVSWHLSGRPEGLESTVTDKLRKFRSSSH